MRHLFAVSSLALSVAAALAASAHAGGNELSMSGSNRGLRSASADALTGDSLGGGSVAYARDLGEVLIPRLHLWARAGIAWGDVQGEMFQTIGTDVSTFELSVGARARYEVWKRVAASVRVDLGAAHTALTLSPVDASDETGARWEPAVTAAAGLDVVAIDWHGFSLGVRGELGYVAAAPAPLTLATATANDGTLRLPATMAPFGHLDVSGPMFAVGLVSTF